MGGANSDGSNCTSNICNFPINISLNSTTTTYADRLADTPRILERVIQEAPELVRTLISATPAAASKCRQHISLQYSIFAGTSALRSVPDDDKIMVQACKSITQQNLAGAVLLLLRGYADAAHEVILGVDVESISEAEYAATHPGQTTWAKDHPQSDAADMFHSVLHRLEGDHVGEGGHTGFANSMYWASGGLKKLPHPADHPIRASLVSLAHKYAPLCVEKGVIVGCGANEEVVRYSIGADGDREVTIHGSGKWDCFRFIELCENINEKLQNDNSALYKELVFLQQMELLLLLQWGLMGEVRVH
eukprot:CAMPEP_0196809106 /NCGR_PEP_ID=MMETSP1362-20130617/9078_1 /TAXON_ID=163516 /ORGANISM="Leptocylindrus danicus, Strain CCMP1856" /LENGTH=304 /DNA_ID=CAMNT_0042183685 /DNA_START=142 /DNA_END=1056 /DNA_ORIENTATION=-